MSNLRPTTLVWNISRTRMRRARGDVPSPLPRTMLALLACRRVAHRRPSLPPLLLLLCALCLHPPHVAPSSSGLSIDNKLGVYEQPSLLSSLLTLQCLSYFIVLGIILRYSRVSKASNVLFDSVLEEFQVCDQEF